MTEKPLPPKTGWFAIAPLFTGDRECLAAFLALESAEVLQGAKPANLINIPDRVRGCGKNFHRLWLQYGEELLAESSLRWKIVGNRGGILLLIYREDLMTDLIGRRDIMTLLHRAGYPAGYSVDAALETLAARVSGDSFPHEIGLFLGYPVKDVVAFMGWSKLPLACQGPWKMYGNPAASIALAERHRTCRSVAAQCLVELEDPAVYLAA